jgi:hypothetical protein
LDPRAHIGYLIGYDSTNIYRVWILHKEVVISTRDVIFDETTFFDNKRTDFLDELIAELDTLIEKIKLPDREARNEAVLEDDEVDIEPIQDFNEVDDLELAKALEDAYHTNLQTTQGFIIPSFVNAWESWTIDPAHHVKDIE